MPGMFTDGGRDADGPRRPVYNQLPDSSKKQEKGCLVIVLALAGAVFAVAEAIAHIVERLV